MKIITIYDKNEEFIEYQYNSIVKHVKSDYEYILFNNGSDIDQIEKIDQICQKLNIKTIKLTSGVTTKMTHSPSIKAGTALNEAFDQLTGKVLKIDSDMFFINDIDLSLEEDLLFIPNGDNNTQIWSGIFGINLDTVTDKLNFLPTHGDTFSDSYKLVENKNYTKKMFCFIHYYELGINSRDKSLADTLTEYCEDIYTINMNGDCNLSLNSTNILSYEKVSLCDEFLNHDWLYKKVLDYREILEKYNFPLHVTNRKYDVDFVVIDNIDCLLHFKSSNWTPNDQYMADKKIALFKFLNNN